MTCFGGPTGTLGGVRESLLLGDRLPQRCPAGKQPACAHPTAVGFLHVCVRVPATVLAARRVCPQGLFPHEAR